MCVLVYQPPKETMTKEIARSLWNRNSDGGGFAFFDEDGAIQTHKTLDFKEWWSKYRNYVTRYPESPFMLHMRIGTQGPNDLSNVHPFTVPEHEGLILGHNGIIPATSTGNKAEVRSDTRIFAEEVLPSLKPGFLDKDPVMMALEDMIGNSKVMFMTSDPQAEHRIYFLNNQKGEWIDDWWFSNTYGLKSTNWYRRKRPNEHTWVSGSYKTTKTAAAVTTGHKAPEPKNTVSGKVDTAAVAVTHYPTETAEAWSRWSELSKVRDEIDAERKQCMMAGNVLIDWSTGYYFCSHCRHSITETSPADCHCWNMTCDNCKDFLAYCACSAKERLPRALKDNELPEVEKNYQKAASEGFTFG